MLRPRSLVAPACALLAAVLAGCVSSGVTADLAGADALRPPARDAKQVTHRIRRGDTLYAIARKHGVDWRDIVRANPWVEPDDLQPGQTLLIPAGALRGPLEDTPARFPPPPGVAPRPEPREPAAPPSARGHAGPIPAERNFIWPVRGAILAGYGRPVAWREGEPNRGIDLRVRAGEPIRAVKSGRVNTFEHVPGYGRSVLVEHTDGAMTFYGYVQDFLIPHGRWVRQGEPVATAGSTRRFDGGRLHLRILRDGRFENPLALLP
jgi:lipoprotein NlpD